MTNLLDDYAEIVGDVVIDHLKQLARPLAGMKVVHVNSTREGGGVAEILNWLIPFKRELGLEAEWKILVGNPEFYQCTKKFHNGLQGAPVLIQPSQLKAYEQTNEKNAEQLRWMLETIRISMFFCCPPMPIGRSTPCSVPPPSASRSRPGKVSA